MFSTLQKINKTFLQKKIMKTQYIPTPDFGLYAFNFTNPQSTTVMKIKI